MAAFPNFNKDKTSRRRTDGIPTFSYVLKVFKNKNHKPDLLKENTACKMEVKSDALFLRGNFSDSNGVIEIQSGEIENITLIKGQENINTFFMSPMRISLKMGVPINVAKKLKIDNSEYQIGDMKIILITNEHYIEIYTNGNAYNHLVQVFNDEFYSDKLTLKEHQNFQSNSK